MRYPFVWIGLAWAAGIGISFLFLNGIPGFWVWPILWLLTAGALIRRGHPSFWFFFLFGMTVLSYLRSECWNIRPFSAVEEFIPEPSSKQNSEWISLQGSVLSEPEIRRKGRKEQMQFILEAQTLGWSGKPFRKYRRVQGKVQAILFQTNVPIHRGDTVRLWGMLKRPQPLMNPGGFDYSAYLARNRIYSVFQGFGPKCARRLKAASPPYGFAWLDRLRPRVIRRIEKVFHAYHVPFFKALVAGDQKDIPEDVRSDFMKTGTSHLLAISGMNLSLLAGSFFVFLLFLGFEQKWAACGGLMIVGLQLVIAGFGIPVQRAALMSAAAFGGLVVEREKNTLNFLFFAFTCLLWQNPRYLEHAGFQLSFLSVLALILFIRGFNDITHRTDEFFSTLAVMALTLPIVLYHFHVVSWISLLANLLAIPCFHLALAWGYLALLTHAVPGLGWGVIHVASFWLDAGLKAIRFFAQGSWGYFYLPTPSLIQSLLYYLFLALFYGIRNQPERFKISFHRSAFAWGAAGLWIMTLLSFVWLPALPGPRMTLFSAGKNEVLHMESTRREHWLLNAGREFPSNQARWILNPFLRSRGAQSVEGIVVTDQQKKHWGGLASLEREFKVRQLWHPPGLFLSGIRRGKDRRIRRISEREEPAMRSREMTWEVIRTFEAVSFQWSYQGWKILIVSEKHLSNSELPWREADLLILPVMDSDRLLALRELLQRVRPAGVAAPFLSEEIQTELRQRGILFWESASAGAIEFQWFKASDRLEVREFLTGSKKVVNRAAA